MNDYLITFIFLLISGIFAVAGLIVLGVAYFKLRKIITSTSLKALVHAKYWEFGAALAALFGLIPLVLIGALAFCKAFFKNHGTMNSKKISVPDSMEVPGQDGKTADTTIHIGSSHAHIFAYITLSLSTILFVVSMALAIAAVNDVNSGGAGNTVYYLTVVGATLMAIAALLSFGALIYIVCAIELHYHSLDDQIRNGKYPVELSNVVKNPCIQ